MPSFQKRTPLGSRKELGTTPLLVVIYLPLPAGKDAKNRCSDPFPIDPHCDASPEQACENQLQDIAAASRVDVGVSVLSTNEE